MSCQAAALVAHCWCSLYLYDIFKCVTHHAVPTILVCRLVREVASDQIKCVNWLLSLEPNDSVDRSGPKQGNVQQVVCKHV
jgi:hypothetical protein